MGKENHRFVFANIVREHSFDSQLNKIAGNYERLDELDSAIDWGLSRAPTKFVNFAADFYLWKMERISKNFPQLRIVYRYDSEAHTVYLIAVEEIRHA